MKQCPVCRTGELQHEGVETWMWKADQWVLFTNVPASKCDVCGEITFAQETAERLADIVAPDSTEQPTGFRRCPEYDIEKLDAVRVPGVNEAGASAR